MKSLTIAHRLLLMIVVSVVSMLLVGLVGLFVAQQSEDSIVNINSDSLQSIESIGRAQQAFMSMRVNVYGQLMRGDAHALAELKETLTADRKTVFQLLDTYEKNMISNDEDRDLLKSDRAAIEAYLTFIDNTVIPLANKGDTEGVRTQMYGPGRKISAEATKAFENHTKYNTKQAANVTEESLSMSNRGKKIILIANVIGIVLIGCLGFFLLANIKASILQIRTIVSRVEQSLDFTARGTVTRRDELGQTTEALNRLLDKLQANLISIAASAGSVAHSANQMSATSSQVAMASQQQSEASTSMASTMEEMTVSINHVADRTQEAREISNESGHLAESGKQIIEQTVRDIQDLATTVNEAASVIRGLEDHTQKISTVVAVIKEVADQTNLLALNAAIEAARAGEQGRGFAVVADEVRKLAERTSSSTAEIASTVGTIRTRASDAVASMQAVTDKVEQGVARAQEASESVHKISIGSRNAVNMVEEITGAIREQGEATTNIANQIERIAQKSEESSLAADKSATTAQELDHLAAEMQKIVSAYRL